MSDLYIGLMSGTSRDSLDGCLVSFRNGLEIKNLKTISFSKDYQSSNDQSFIDEEIANNPDFKDISENEKAILKAFVAWPSALLENFGFRNILAQKGILQGLRLLSLKI